MAQRMHFQGVLRDRMQHHKTRRLQPKALVEAGVDLCPTKSVYYLRMEENLLAILPFS